MAKTPKTELFINVVHKIDQDREYGRFESIFLVREEPATCEDTGLRNPSGGRTFGLGLYNGLFLDDLTLSALYRRATAEKRLTFMLDAMAYRRPFSVNERTAMAMAKTLRKLDKGLKTLRETDGWIDDYCSFVFRIAKLTGAKVIWPEFDSGWLTTTRFTEFASPAELQAHVTALMEK